MVITPWLEQFWKQCTGAFHQERLAHALLISGSAGLGKYAFSEALAQKILCTNKETEPCDQCQSCLWFKAKSHADFFLISPEEEKKQISIAQIRDLTESLTKTPSGRYQVVIIYPAETMNRAAANALLKTLEEPNGRVILLLVSDHPTALLPTIRSRCLEYRVQQPSTELSLSWLNAQLSQQPPASEKSEPTKKRTSKKEVSLQSVNAVASAEELLALADGLPFRALRLAQSGEWQQHKIIAADFLRVLSGKLSLLKAAERWSKQSPVLILGILATVIQDMIRLMTGLGPAEIQHHSLLPEMQALLPKCQLPQIWLLMKKITEAKRLVMSSANPNVQLLLEALLLSFLEIQWTNSV